MYFPVLTLLVTGASSAFTNNSTSSGCEAISSKSKGENVRFSKNTVRIVGELMITEPKSRKLEPEGVSIRYRCEWMVRLYTDCQHVHVKRYKFMLTVDIS